MVRAVQVDRAGAKRTRRRAGRQGGKAVIAKLNIDEALELAARFGITAIPTLIVFKNGQPTATLRGGQSKAVILKSLAAT
jgi:thioredoxin 1